MIRVLLDKDEMCQHYFDIHAEHEGEIVFVISTINTLSPNTLGMWGADPYFWSTDFYRYEIVWCMDDTEGFPLANKIYEYIKDFGFEVKIIEEKA